MDRYAQQFADTQLSTGVRLRYAEQGDPAGHPIILLHGYTDSWFSFSQVLPALATSYHVYALDQRGHGESARPAHGYTIADFAADVVAFLDALDLPRATVLGHSMGSFVAQQVARAAPERVARLIQVGSAASACNAGVLELAHVVDTLDDPIPVAFVRDFQASTVYQPLPDQFMDRVVAESLKVPARVWRMTLAGLLAENGAKPLDHIQAPTLILWGDQDTVFLRADQDALMAGLPDAILKVYPETGHALHWERPAQFVRDLADFIAHVS